MGTRVKVGDELFRKIDYTYPLEFAKLAQKLGAKHYGLLSSQGADANSMLLYTRTKGQVERDVVAANQRGLIIYRPGLLLNRRNDERFGEKIGSWIPFLPKIEARDMGAAMIEGAVQQIKNQSASAQLLTNQQIRDMLAASKL